ncbi:MAG: DUF445 domain-containing protein [Hyphomonadaceae bacterium]
MRSIDAPPAAGSLAFMRALATGLLVLMVIVFLAARAFEAHAVWIGYIRAFAEAATIGALADWFAVTALFRRPLGLPIPHTAIIPRSKERIGAGLGRFLESNFLSPELVGARLAKIDVLGEAAAWAAQPGRAALLARNAADALPRALDLVDDSPVEQALKAFAAARLREADIATMAADLIDFVVSRHRHQGLMDHLLRAADALLSESEGDIRARIRDRAGFLGRILLLDKKAANALIGAARSAIRDMATDPLSDMRQRFDGALLKLATDLRAAPELRAEVDELKARILEHPEIQAFAGALWQAVKRDLKTGAGSLAEGGLAQALESAVLSFAHRIRADDELRDALNERLRLWAMRLAKDRGEDVTRFVAETIGSWDARTVIARIEAGVGADLQYIRISGTLIGGLAGVGLHTIEALVFR